jgi:hypothetical protein
MAAFQADGYTRIQRQANQLVNAQVHRINDPHNPVIQELGDGRLIDELSIHAAASTHEHQTIGVGRWLFIPDGVPHPLVALTLLGVPAEILKHVQLPEMADPDGNSGKLEEASITASMRA